MVFVAITGDKYDPDAYDRDAFYTTDVGGGSARARIADDAMRAIVAICNDDTFPHYHTQADFIRDAIIHLLHYRQQQVTDPLLRLSLEEDLAEMRAHRAMQQLDEKAKAQEKSATIILSRYWKVADPKVRVSMAQQARKLVQSSMVDDNLKDDLRKVVMHWNNYTQTQVEGESLKDLLF